MPKLILKKGREKSLLRKHPWIFSGGVKKVDGDPRPGDTIDIVSADGRWLAHGAYSPKSKIVTRAWSFKRDDEITGEFFQQKLESCVSLRKVAGLNIPEKACRLVNAESDGLPGVVIDRYGDYLSGQFMTAGAEKWKREIAPRMLEITGCKGFFERSDGEIRRREGLKPKKGLLFGDEPPETVEIDEQPAKFLVDIKEGHKTGYYLDQRDNRRAVMEHSKNKDVLNCFSYTGGFGVTALLGGAGRVTNIDVSGPALDIARKNVELNNVAMRDVSYFKEDVFEALRRYRDQGRTFDVIVLDPPKFTESRAMVQKACRGYKDINLTAAQLLNPGGLLFTYSCSGLISEDLFQKVVAGALLDSKRDGRIVRKYTQAPDHPTNLAFPEGFYLKGLLVQVV